MNTHVVEESSVETKQQMVPLITALLVAAGHPNPHEWETRVHQDAFTAEPHLQRFLINRFWRLEIGSYPIDTIKAREGLAETSFPDDWVRIFEKGVLPCIMSQVQSTKHD